MRKSFVVLLWFYYISCAMGAYHSDVNDDEENEKGYDEAKYNVSRQPTTPGRTMKGEVVVEKFVDTLMASERYLKMIGTVEDKLGHLESIVNDRSNAILKYLVEVLRVMKSSPAGVLESTLQSLKNDLDKLKQSVQQAEENPNLRVDNMECNLEATLDTRLSFLESHMKSVMTTVEAISTVISEVKNRQGSRNSNKQENQFRQFGDIGIDSMTLISEFRRALQELRSRKCDCKIGRTDRSERYPTDCHEIQAQGFNITGIYKIKPEDIEPFYVLCDLNSAGGGWTVIQNRFDGSQDFFKSWLEYKNGFGNLAGEFWIGLEKVYYLTNQKLYELRIEMEGQNRQEAYATFSVFTIGPEYEGYRISTLGTYRGTAGDSLSYHAGQKFSTYDTDNDEWKDGSCASEHGGAWWYKECDKSNLNGKYLSTADESSGQTIHWISFKGPHAPLYKTRIMIRPLPASRPTDYNVKPRTVPDKIKNSNEKMKNRGKEQKSPYEMNRGRTPYRYDDNVHPDGFFPNYA